MIGKKISAYFSVFAGPTPCINWNDSLCVGSDALTNFDTLYNQNRGFEKEKFDVILTNPPFGAVVKKEESDYLDNYELGEGKKSQKTEILFLERCFDFLKWETGKLVIILPDGILNNSSLQYVRDYIEQRFQILAVVSLPQIAFRFYKAGVKPSILFLRKFSQGSEASQLKKEADAIVEQAKERVEQILLAEA